MRRFERTFLGWVVTAAVVGALAPAAGASAPSIKAPPNGASGSTSNEALLAAARAELAAKAAAAAASKPKNSKRPAGQSPANPASNIKSRVEIRLSLACGTGRASTPDAVDDSRCTLALTACSRRTPPSDEVMYYVWTRQPGKGWVRVGDTCGTSDVPPGTPAPPPVPTFGQIQTAFRALPFAQPAVNIQPEGDVTLVNLPTYFEAQWPASGLAPGEVSEKVQLLSWSVEFKIAPGTYNYDFGDGTRSGATKDLGGPHPKGNIRHTYQQPNPAAQVKVDGQLTGWFRVNGGAWEPIDTVAELQNEPVVTLQVREAKARLYGKQ